MGGQGHGFPRMAGIMEGALRRCHCPAQVIVHRNSFWFTRDGLRGGFEFFKTSLFFRLGEELEIVFFVEMNSLFRDI